MVDKYGNKFKLRGHLNRDSGKPVDKIIYDVWLLSAK